MEYIIIVAGGKGLRMGSDVPKQFLPIGGKPVLMRTMERFKQYSEAIQVILVLPKAQQEYWAQLCKEYDFHMDYLLADGGETRFHSVQHGLALIPDDAEGVVGVHDGVRPFPSIEVIRRCYETAREAKAVIPVIPVVETLRHIGKDYRTTGLTANDTSLQEKEKVLQSCSPCKKTSTTVPRDEYRLVQTPQCFDIQLLKAANRSADGSPVGAAAFTDDASVVEAFGFDVTLVEGNRENIKITTPYDLAVAECIMHNS